MRRNAVTYQDIVGSLRNLSVDRPEALNLCFLVPIDAYQSNRLLPELCHREKFWRHRADILSQLDVFDAIHDLGLVEIFNIVGH